MSEFTLIHPEGKATLSVSVDRDRVYVDRDVVADVLGWQLREEGLCRGDVCVPVTDRAALADERGVDLRNLAEVLSLPLVLDAEAGAGAVGTPHAERAALLDGALAPDFRLPDFRQPEKAGRMHSLSDYRGSKVLLIAYASW